MKIMQFDFKKKVVLVTGGAQGLGFAIGNAFALSGASVALCDINEEAVKKAALAIPAGLSQAAGFFMDVTNETSVKAAFDQARQSFGSVQILINNAGICSTEGFSDLSLERWNRTMAVNLTGAFICMKAAIPDMKKAAYGKIINIGSVAGRGGGFMVSAAYSTSKSAIGGLTKAAAKQLAGNNILVNCIAPGTLETDLIADWDEDKLENIRKATLLSRLGTVDDITGAALFLASSAGDYVTGVTLDVNGGLYIAP